MTTADQTMLLERRLQHAREATAAQIAELTAELLEDLMLQEGRTSWKTPQTTKTTQFR